jgi:hypothetical protein
VYAARLLSDKMLVYANAFRDEVEGLITSLLVTGHEKDSSNTSYFCNDESPSDEWAQHPGGLEPHSVFSFVPKNSNQQDLATKGSFRRRKIAPLDASLFQKTSSCPVSNESPLTSSSPVHLAGSIEEGVCGNGKSIRGRRKWSVGLGEQEIVDNVGATPVCGRPAVLSPVPIPVQSAIQWGKRGACLFVCNLF